MFAHSITTNGRAPVDLKSQINIPAPEDDLGKQLEKTVNVYNLRRGRTPVKSIIPETKYETLTFKHFFPRLLSFYKHLDFSVRKDSFRLQINLNLNENLKIFLDKFPKFDIKYTAFYRKKPQNPKTPIKFNANLYKIISKFQCHSTASLCTFKCKAISL